jgi:hypothetical protein
MNYETIKILLQEFDYDKNSKEDLIEFLELCLYNLKEK